MSVRSFFILLPFLLLSLHFSFILFLSSNLLFSLIFFLTFSSASLFYASSPSSSSKKISHKVIPPPTLSVSLYNFSTILPPPFTVFQCLVRLYRFLCIFLNFFHLMHSLPFLLLPNILLLFPQPHLHSICTWESASYLGSVFYSSQSCLLKFKEKRAEHQALDGYCQNILS